MKECFKCHETLPLSAFYRHPGMADGHLGKCQACARRDVSENRKARREQYAEAERERNRKLPRRLQKMRYARRSAKRHPERAKARIAANNAVRDGVLARQPCEVCGTELGVQKHHTDYSKPLEVRWLCVAHHHEEHARPRAEVA